MQKSPKGIFALIKQKMKNIIDIYKDYKIMSILTKHHLRVASVAMEICESLDVKVETENIIKACLLHDIGNIIKFKLDHFPEENEPEGILYWQEVQNEFIQKYGKDEHHASLMIAKELNVSSQIYDLVDAVEPLYVEAIAKEENLGKKICLYSDNRVTPHGVVSIEERNIEAQERYKNHPHSFSEEDRISFIKNMREIENQIFSHSNIKPEDINDESIKNYLEKLQSISI